MTSSIVTSLAFHPNELVVASSYASGRIIIADFEKFSTNFQVSAPPGVDQLIWSPDGTCLMAVSPSRLYVWNTSDLNNIQACESVNIESFKCFAFGYAHFVIFLNYSGSTISTWFYDLQNLGLFTQTPVIQPTTEMEVEETPVVQDDAALIAQLSNSKLLYTLRNRLDHLRTLRATWSNKNCTSIFAAISKQSTAARPELLGELLAAKIIQTALNTEPTPQVISDDLATFISLLKPSLRNMSEPHQLIALEYLQQLVPAYSGLSTEKFGPLREEVSKLTTAPSVVVATKATRVEALFVNI